MNSVQLFAFTCGTVTVKKRMAIDDGVGLLQMPIPAFLIRHPAGNVLFDTGLHADLLDPSSTRLGEMGKHMTLTFSPEEHILARLETLGLRASDIAVVINSHLHYDHAGGNSCFPHAKVYLQRPEWEAAHDSELIRRNGYNPQDYANASNVVCVDGEHDLYGDRSIVLTPTHGHTPGHQCLLVRTVGRSFILSGDACYLSENLARCAPPRLSFNVGQARSALERLAAMQRSGTQVIIGHDPEMWRFVPKAPVPIA